MTAGKTPTSSETHRVIEATFRFERARLIAGLARFVGSVDLAEELAQEALVVALSEWPRTGVPTNPGAWLPKRSPKHQGRLMVSATTGSRILGLTAALLVFVPGSAGTGRVGANLLGTLRLYGVKPGVV